QRVSAHRAAIDDYLTRAKPTGPVILVGASEGGDVAAAVAAAEPRITHVILMGSGGGWTQAEEFRWFIANKGSYLGMKSAADLQRQLAIIRADPDGDAEWLGHPHRRWATFMFERPVDELLKVNASILMLHGDADENVPVGSARALRGAFAAAGKQNLRYIEYSGVDHRFQRADGTSAFPLAEVDIVGWMRDTGALGKAEADEFNRRVRNAHPESFAAPAK
ncbi:MAG: alpha/beta hydrolase family protein, partial [Phycisphaerales bacterium]